jgi:DNA repair exonuclease SbcCD nuclease subunit
MSFSRRVKNGVKKAVSWITNFEHTAAELAIEKQYDYVICGHIHQPQKRIITNEKGSVTYLNSGDWVENLTALEYYEHDWHIYQFDPASHEKVKLSREKPVVSVESAEVMMYFQADQQETAPFPQEDWLIRAFLRDPSTARASY